MTGRKEDMETEWMEMKRVDTQGMHIHREAQR